MVFLSDLSFTAHGLCLTRMQRLVARRLLQITLQMRLRRYNDGAFPRLVTLDCRNDRRYRFLKGIDELNSLE